MEQRVDNRAPSLLFQRGDRAEANSLCVKLEGPDGNQHAIGARVQLVMTDQSVQVAEVTAGCGHMSQSSARSFFGYRADNVPHEVKVTWPDGTTTSHTVDRVEKLMVIKHP